MAKSLIKLSLSNLQFYSYHGVKAEEQTLGGRYQVDVDLWYNPMSAVISDDVAKAVNYEEIVFITSNIPDSNGYYPGLVQKFDVTTRSWNSTFNCKVVDANR